MGNSASYKEQANALKVESPAVVLLLEQLSGTQNLPLCDVFWDVFVDTLDKLAQAVPDANLNGLLDHVASGLITHCETNQNLAVLVLLYSSCLTHSVAFCCKLPRGQSSGREFNHFLNLLHSIVTHIISYIVSHTNHVTAEKLLRQPLDQSLIGEIATLDIERHSLTTSFASLCLYDARRTFPSVLAEYGTRGGFVVLTDKLLESMIKVGNIYASFVACLDHDGMDVVCTCSGQYAHYCVQAALAGARDPAAEQYCNVPPLTLGIPKPHRVAAWQHRLCSLGLAVLSCSAYTPSATPEYIQTLLNHRLLPSALTTLLRVTAPGPENSSPRAALYDFVGKDLHSTITTNCSLHLHQDPMPVVASLVSDANAVYVLVAAEHIHRPLLDSSLFFDTEWASALDPQGIATLFLEAVLTLRPLLVRQAVGIDGLVSPVRMQIPSHLLTLDLQPHTVHARHPVFLYFMLQHDPLSVLVTSQPRFPDLVLTLANMALHRKNPTLVQCLTLLMQDPHVTFDLHCAPHDEESSVGSFLLLSMFSHVLSNLHRFEPKVMEIYLHFLCVLTQNAVDVSSAFLLKMFSISGQCFHRQGTFFEQHAGELEKAGMLLAKHQNAEIQGITSKPSIVRGKYDLDAMSHVSLTLECCMHLLTTLLTPRLVNANPNVQSWLSIYLPSFIDFTTKLGGWTRHLRRAEAQAFLLSKRFPEKTLVITTEDGIVEIPKRFKGELKSSECVLPIVATELPSFAKGISRLMPLVVFLKNCIAKKTDGQPVDAAYLSLQLLPLHSKLREQGYDSAQFQYHKILTADPLSPSRKATLESETALKIRLLPLPDPIPYSTTCEILEEQIWSTAKQQKWVVLNESALQPHIQHALQQNDLKY